MNIPERILLKGPQGREIVHWGLTQESIYRKFPDCSKLGEEEIKKVIRICKHYTDSGLFPINEEKFKSLGKNLFEIKGYQARLIGFFDNRRFVIVHCVQKKKDKHEAADLAKAKSLRERYFYEKESRTNDIL